MHDYTQKKQCEAIIGSMTQAMRAQKVLAAALIPAEVIKSDSSQTQRGCAYGVSYSCHQEWNVQKILQEAGIRPDSYERKRS